MFGNNLMTALVTLKTLADQQSDGGSSLKVALVAAQYIRQYTGNSPGCSTAKYINVGGSRQYTPQGGRQTDRPKDRQTHRQTNRKTETETERERETDR